ncbi:MAG: lamin tail domain-containing protein [Parabacteroides sp.]|nr:lamin tail domain-containing protein [Parabacteroides sp.]MCI7705778.1 lamin tail domain-containing protein [Parabacteroides sp.]MDY5621673.1 lamin tail domain-containing protein [Bacteroidales bacterium]
MKQILLFFLVNLPLLVFSQFQETFESQELPESWIGNRQQFVINDGVLKVNGQEQTETVSLSYPYSIEGNEQEWEFYLYLKDKPTTKNRIKIFPASPDKTPSGFYICAGYNKPDRLRLGINDQEIQAFPDFDDEERCILHIIITCKEQRYWSFSVGNALSDEATKRTASFESSYTFPSQANFCIQVTHTKTRTDDFGIDDICYRTKITEQPEEPGQTEQSSVELTAIQPISLSEVSFEFNGPVSLENAVFSISGYGFEGKCSAVRSIYQDNNHQVVMIRFSQAMTLNEEYTFYIENLKDEQGAIIPDASYTFLLQEEETPETPEEQPEDPIETYPEKAIRINEVMADPDTCGWPEYVELYNTQDKTISLDGWIFDYGNGYKRKGLDGFSIPANGYVILFHAKHTDIFPENIAIPIETFPQLFNNGKTLALYAGEKCIDSYSYPQAKPACSWEYDEDGWHLSTDPRGGTPGESNSEPTTTEEEPEEEPDEPETPVVPEEPEQPEESYPKGSVIIHEVMADPKGLTALPETEYIELYNKVDQSIDLSNWILNYGTTPIALTGIVIPAHGWAVLYRSGREIEVGNGQACPLDKFPSALANTGKELSLYDANGQLMDQYTYPKAKPACSWEFDEEGWHLSSDPRGGTPGEANSEAEENEEDPDETPDEPEEETNPEPEIPEAQQPQPGDIIINELLPEPFVDGSEYIELYNRSEQELSLKDVCISTRKSDGSLNTRYPLEAYPQTLQAGDYLLLTKSIEGVENFYSLPASQNWLECKLPVLSNTGSTVVLYRGEGEIIIDEVSYSPKWHAPTVKNKKGVALERKDPDKDSQNADNWTSAASSAGFGTPGLENSQYLNGETETDSEEIDDPIYQPTGTFQIPYRLNQSGYMARGWIFDLSGRKVALIADNTSLGTQGYLEWNGKGRDGSPVNTGIYIIYLELWHPGGNVIRKKQVLLIP